MPEIALGVMARFPRTGEVKTRLARSIGNDRALTIYRSLLGQACKLVTELNPTEILRTAFVTPSSDLPAFKAAYPGFDGVFEQIGDDLGERMKNALGRLLSASGIRVALLIGADCPELTAKHIHNAVSSLSNHDLTLGPTADGGYYLIGLKKARPELFYEIKWGTNTVMNSTLAVAKYLSLSTGLLPMLRDFDDERDMDYFDGLGLI